MTKTSKVDKVSKSSVIRELFDEGYTISEIAAKLNVHYSFAHGVVRRYEEVKVEAPRANKAEEIRKLHDQGHTTPEIVAALSVSASHVSNVLRVYQTNKRRKK